MSSNKRPYLFTSESVTEGHPDKVCDQISDAILDAHLAQDPDSRIAVEAMAKGNNVYLLGEVTSKAVVDLENVVRDRITTISYTDPALGFDASSCTITINLTRQSPDIDRGVSGQVQGAGDQGLMFGFACDETPELMPAPIAYAHALARRLADVRRFHAWGQQDLRPDGKTQVTVRYEDGEVTGIDAVVVSTQHAEGVKMDDVVGFVLAEVIRPVLPPDLVHPGMKILINPTGRFVLGGPVADAGLTGRKIIVDTYGGAGRHGGGAFSGKDPTKVDRSAAYMARHLAKAIVAAGLARRCEVQLSYAIGVAEPVSVLVDTFGTGSVPDMDLEVSITRNFDLRPQAIIEYLNLRRPIYTPTAAYGHFGRAEFPWEEVTAAVARLR